MKSLSSLLRTGVIILALAFLATASSCGNVGGGGNNNNGGDSSGGGNNNGGSGGDNGDDGKNNNGDDDGNLGVVKDECKTVNLQLKFNIVDENLVKIACGEIRVKSKLFADLLEREYLGASEGFLRVVRHTESGDPKKLFEVIFTNDDNTEATGGLVLAGNGDLTKFGDFSPLAPKAITAYGAEFNKDIHIMQPRDSDSSTGMLKKGLDFFSVFGNTDGPLNKQETDLDHAPFAFTALSTYQPIFFCRTVVTGIDGDHVRNNSTLAGGQKAECFATFFTKAGANKYSDHTKWMATPASTTFKKAFNVSFAGVQTEAKTIVQLGLPGDANAQRNNFTNNGLSPEEMQAIVDDGNPTKYTKLMFRIVRDSDFATDEAIPAPPVFSVKSRDPNLAKVVEGVDGTATVFLKVSAFPANATMTATANFAPGLSNMVAAFDVEMTPATGGLVLAGKGNLSLGQFTTRSECVGGGPDDNAAICLDVFNRDGDPISRNGLSVFGNFMDKSTPGNSNPNAAPFAFTASTGDDGAQPIIICHALITSITSSDGRLGNAIENSSTFAGGQKATCYVGSAGGTSSTENKGLGTESVRQHWLNAVRDGGHFKTKFDMAFAGIKTEGRPFSDMGWLGANITAKKSDFSSGIDSTTMTSLMAHNPTTYKKVTVELVTEF